MRSSTHSQDDAGAAARSPAAMNSRLSSRARDPGGLGPKLTRRFRSAKARFASNSPPEAKVGVLRLLGCKQPRLWRDSGRPSRKGGERDSKTDPVAGQRDRGHFGAISRLRSSGRYEGLYEVFHSFPLPTTGFFLQVFRKLLQGRP